VQLSALKPECVPSITITFNQILKMEVLGDVTFRKIEMQKFIHHSIQVHDFNVASNKR